MKRLLFFLLLAGCGSDAQTYCENVGDCSNKGSSDWIAACNDETSALDTEAENAGCATQFDAYFSCTRQSFTCDGITSDFPGCDRSALDACIANAQSSTSCAELAKATSACGATDAGATSCDATRDCNARCYLQNVANPCAPTPAEIEAVTACGASCPQ